MRNYFAVSVTSRTFSLVTLYAIRGREVLSMSVRCDFLDSWATQTESRQPLAQDTDTVKTSN